jgi:hypothetical protein
MRRGWLGAIRERGGFMITNLFVRIEETDFHGFTSFAATIATEKDGARRVLHHSVNHETRAQAEASVVASVAAIFGFEGAITLYAGADHALITRRGS